MCNNDNSNYVSKLDDHTFKDFIENDAVLVLFIRDDCKLGRKQLSSLKPLAFMYPEFYVGLYNGSHNVDFAIDYAVHVTPTFLLFRRGRLQDRVSGFQEEDELMELFHTWLKAEEKIG